MTLRALPAILFLASTILPAPADDFTDAVAELEQTTGGHIGVAVLDSATGAIRSYRPNERFAMASTFKALLAGAILARVDSGDEQLDRPISYAESDLLSYAPITKKNLPAGRLTVGELCAAAVELSDNTAANLLLETIGGPAALTAYLRSLDDATTRLDRNEPTLNTNLPGDERDTTTPAAMANTLNKLLLGGALSTPSRKQLNQWMIACQTGAAKLRAGLPPGWKVGDKTGSGENGASNDIAIIWPPNQPPIIVAAYTSGLSGPSEDQSAIVAEVGRIVAIHYPGSPTPKR